MTVGGVGCSAYNILNIWQVFITCVEVEGRFEQRAFYIGSLKVKLILACQEVLKMSLALNEPK
jgi:hypothetical protein